MGILIISLSLNNRTHYIQIFIHLSRARRDCERDRALSHSLYERGERTVDVKSICSTSPDPDAWRATRAQIQMMTSSDDIQRRLTMSSDLDEIELRSTRRRAQILMKMMKLSSDLDEIDDDELRRRSLSPLALAERLRERSSSLALSLREGGESRGG